MIQTESMNIGIMGGTFNPPHNAHLNCAIAALNACDLQQVLFIPAGDPPHKPLAGDISFEIRCEMTAIAIADHTDFTLSQMEGKRSGKSYSIDTINELSDSYPQDNLFFIIGSDSLLELGTWHRYAEIVRKCNLIVIERPGKGILAPHHSLPIAIRNDFIYISKSRILSNKIHSTQIYFVKSRLFDISSTEIRTLASRGENITHLVPTALAEYIKNKRIYNR